MQRTESHFAQQGEFFMDELKSILNTALVEAEQLKNPFIQLNDIVYKILERAIINFELTPGTRLSVAQISDLLGVSRTPVTYALEQLKQENLVSSRPGHRGYYVWDISYSSLEMNFMARRALEGTATYICAQRGIFRKDDRPRILAEQFEAAVMERNFAKFSETDTSFHRLIIQSSGNPYILKAYQQMERYINYYSIRSEIYLLAQTDDYALDVLAGQHLAIYNAIMTGIPELAENCAKQHLETCYNLSIRYHKPIVPEE